MSGTGRHRMQPPEDHTPAPEGATPPPGPGQAPSAPTDEPVFASERGPATVDPFRPAEDVELDAQPLPSTSAAWEPGRQQGLPSDYDHTARATALVIGEALVDVVTSPGEDGTTTTTEHPGGSPANVALGLGRLGRDVELVTSFAADERGQQLRMHLEGSEVRIAAGSAGADRTSTARADVDGEGSASYTFDLAWAPPAVEPERAPLVLHTGSIAAVLEPGARTVGDAVTRYREQATITYDPNARPALMGAPEQARSTIEALVARADVVKVSTEDLEWLAPDEDSAQVARDWIGRGAGIVVVTSGAQGAWAVTAGGGEVEVPGTPVTVADTVGAGDAFMAGMIDALWQADLLGGHRRQNLRGIDPQTLREVLEQAAKIAAITVSRAGANPPYRAELA